jgi:hypothetical protein
MKNGIIGFLCEDRKVIDLKITNSFTMIALQPKATLFAENDMKIDVSGFQHLAIPADLSIHLTKRLAAIQQPGYVFFDSPKLQEIVTTNLKTPFVLFTFVSAPILLNRPLQGVWDQAVIISPSPDKEYNPQVTRVFIDFFVHAGESTRAIAASGVAVDGMRLAPDRRGFLFGPFALEDFQRKSKLPSDLFFTIRFGFVEMTVAQDCFIYVAYRIKRRGNSG